jgi:hypothetical protein
MFAYDARAAAAALSDIEPFVEVDRLEEGLPASAEAWLAWHDRLRAAGRDPEADARLAAVHARWPRNLAAVAAAASVAAGRGDVDDLARIVPASLELPATIEAAPLHAYRAWTKAASGDAAGARADALRAIALSHGEPSFFLLAGDALAATDPSLARNYWTRSLHSFWRIRDYGNELSGFVIASRVSTIARDAPGMLCGGGVAYSPSDRTTARRSTGLQS